MKRLHLLRHAHAAPGDPAGADHDRPLSATGQEECRRLAAWWKQDGPDLDLVLCSTAVRAAETYEALREGGTELPEATYSPKLYLASPAEILNTLKNMAKGKANVLVIGHNPGLHELGLSLDTAQGAARQTLEHGLPTATLLSYDAMIASWKHLAESGATLTDRHSPGS